jgi:hypothetical protein
MVSPFFRVGVSNSTPNRLKIRLVNSKSTSSHKRVKFNILDAFKLRQQASESPFQRVLSMHFFSDTLLFE